MENNIVAISEHWLHENRLGMFNEIAGDIRFCGRASNFAKADNYGTRRGQGGVALLWKYNMVGVTEISNVIHDRICGIRIATKDGGTLNIFSVYLPAQGCGEDFEACLDDLAEIIESREQGSMNIIFGDFNADMGSLGGSRGKRAATKQGTALLRLVNEFGLTACNLDRCATGPVDTFCGPTEKSTIDYKFVPQEASNRIKACQVIGNEVLNTSDHNPVQVTLNIDNVRCYTRARVDSSIKRWEKLSEQERNERYCLPLAASTDEIIARLTSPTLDEGDLDRCIEDFVERMKEAASNIPSRKFRKHLKPYWNSRMNELKKDKIDSYRKWSKANRPRDA